MTQGQGRKPALYALPTFYKQPNAITVVFHDGGFTPAPKPPPAKLADLTAVEPPLIHLRDGEVVLYRVSRSSYWQARIRLLTPKWIRFSTRQRNQIDAACVACERYDEARYRERLGLAPTLKRFEDIGRACIEDLEREMAAGAGKRVYTAYIGVIQRYFIPYFGQMYLTSISAKDMLAFEAWRNQQMGRTPRASTLLNFSSALNRIHQTAVARGWISERVPLPKLQGKGEKGQARPAFSEAEIQKLRDHLRDWHLQVTGKTAEMRRLLRDLVDVLLLTGMRQGTESMNLQWRHIDWHEDKGVRYLRIWVSGKTGPRWLIAKHECAAALARLHDAQPPLAGMSFEALIAAKLNRKVFCFEDGSQPYEFTHVFRRLLAELGMSKNEAGLARSLYSLRHSYATRELLGGMDIHTLAKQMGTSVVMLERHYSKLVATMAAERLA